METSQKESFVAYLNQNLGIAHKICRVYFTDDEDRQDAFQEMMYQLWSSFPGFKGQSKFSTWMYQVCLNTAMTFRRKNKRNEEFLLNKHYQIADQPSESEDDIALLLKAIGTLSALNKAIILLYLEDLSYEEISRITGLSKSNVSVKLVRIKRELELILKPHTK
jgi:RNA polymerase sigma factor (sigma-70 family)